MNVSIIVPTHLSERLDWLKHRLNFLYRLGYQGEVVVGVWGGHDRMDELKSFAATFSPNIVLLRQDANTRFTSRVLELAMTSRGKYIVQQGDDDFIYAGGMARSIELLDRDPSVCCAQGRCIALDPATHEPYLINSFPLWQALDDDVLPRYNRYMKHYGTTFHAIFRRHHFIERMQYMDETMANAPNQLFEYMGEMYAIIKGKFVLFDEIFFIKGLHNKNASKTDRDNLSDKFPPYMVLSADFSPSMKFFEGQIIRLMEAAGVNASENRKDILDGLIDFMGWLVFKRRDLMEPQEIEMQKIVSQTPLHPAINKILGLVSATRV